MASLIVDRVECEEETDEVGSDDVYMVVFRGNTTPPFGSNIGVHAPAIWQDFDTGEKENVDRTIASFIPTSVYVVMLVEEDNDRDIAGSEVIGAWKTACDLTWKAQMATGNSPATAAAAIASTMKGLASIYMSFPKGNDDVIAVKRVPAGSGNVFFVGDGGRYEVTLKVA